MTDDLTAWLLGQIAEDERMITEAGPCRLGWGTYRKANSEMIVTAAVAESTEDTWITGGMRTIPDSVLVVFDPARELAECAAKRRIIRMYANAVAAVQRGSVSARNRAADETAVDLLGSVLKEYGVVYAEAGREGYREEWRS